MSPTRGVSILLSNYTGCDCWSVYHSSGVGSEQPIAPVCVSLWPNWIRRLTTNQKIGGSSPSRDTFCSTGAKFLESNGQIDHLAPVFFGAWMPERSKGADLRSAGRLSAWVRTPLQALIVLEV